ncbi:hypothetical protein J6590_073211 [Homalodisca vitripennis]|nr:hypothetical protein J6590_073211 [Homalodisca vitripennis]
MSGPSTSKAANDESRLASNLVHWGSEIDRLIDSDDSSDDVDYAQQEIQNESRASSESENEPELGGGDTNHRKNKPRKRPDMAWEGMETFHGQREIFTENSGPNIEKDSILDTFQYFFDDYLVDLIVTETNRYADQEMSQRGMVFSQFSTMWKWVPCTNGEMYILLAMYMLMSSVKPTGTIKLNRQGITKNLRNAKLKKGEMMAVHSDDVAVFKWCDKRVVSLISTYHDVEMMKLLKNINLVFLNKYMVGHQPSHLRLVLQKGISLRRFLLLGKNPILKEDVWCVINMEGGETQCIGVQIVRQAYALKNASRFTTLPLTFSVSNNVLLYLG